MDKFIRKLKLQLQPKENPKFSDFFRFPLSCHRLLGVNLIDKPVEAKTLREKVQQIVQVAFKVAIVVILMVDIVLRIIFVTQNRVSGLIPNILTILSNINSFVKFVNVVINRKVLCELVHELWDLYPTSILDQNECGIGKFYAYFIRFRYMHLSGFLIGGIRAICGPLYSLLVKGVWFNVALATIWLPFDLHQSIAFTFVYVSQIIMKIVSSLVLLGPAWLYYAMVSMLVISFTTLHNDFSDLNHLTGTAAWKDQLIVLVKRHQHLLALLKKAIDAFAYTASVNYCVNSILLCMSSYTISFNIDAQNFSNVFHEVMHLIGINFGAFFFCFCAQKLTDASESIADAAYDCGWENVDDTKAKEMILMVVMRAQHTKKTRALKFIVISLESMTIVST